MGSMGEELQVLRTRAEEATRLESEVKEAAANTIRLEGLYQAEQARVKYCRMAHHGSHVRPLSTDKLPMRQFGFAPFGATLFFIFGENHLLPTAVVCCISTCL